MTAKQDDFVPGAAKHGNFICYYDFHPVEERLKLMPYEKFTLFESPILVLDVGCNTGDLILQFLKDLEAHTQLSTHCLAIDIDPTLIERARLNTHTNTTFECLDVMSDAFLPSAKLFLTNTVFKDQFDVVTLFSVTMWIHLNHGDTGLKRGLSQLSSLARYMIVEAQPWKCYRAAQRRMKRANKQPFLAHWSTIKFRETVEDDIKNFLTQECRMNLLEETERTPWNRKIMIFERNAR